MILPFFVLSIAFTYLVLCDHSPSKTQLSVVKKRGFRYIFCMQWGEQGDLLIMHGCCLITNLQAAAILPLTCSFYLCKGIICIPYKPGLAMCSLTSWHCLELGAIWILIWILQQRGAVIMQDMPYAKGQMERKTLKQPDGGYWWCHALRTQVYKRVLQHRDFKMEGIITNFTKQWYHNKKH